MSKTTDCITANFTEQFLLLVLVLYTGLTFR